MAPRKQPARAVKRNGQPARAAKGNGPKDPTLPPLLQLPDSLLDLVLQQLQPADMRAVFGSCLALCRAMTPFLSLLTLQVAASGTPIACCSLAQQLCSRPHSSMELRLRLKMDQDDQHWPRQSQQDRVLGNCSAVRSLHLQGQSRADGASRQLSPRMWSLAKQCPSLVAVQLTNCVIHLQDLACLATPLLRKLGLEFCSASTSRPRAQPRKSCMSTLTDALQGATQLGHLEVLHGIMPLGSLACLAPSLATLVLDGIEVDSLEGVALGRMQRLQRVELGWWSGAHLAALRTLAVKHVGWLGDNSGIHAHNDDSGNFMDQLAAAWPPSATHLKVYEWENMDPGSDEEGVTEDERYPLYPWAALEVGFWNVHEPPSIPLRHLTQPLVIRRLSLGLDYGGSALYPAEIARVDAAVQYLTTSSSAGCRVEGLYLHHWASMAECSEPERTVLRSALQRLRPCLAPGAEADYLHSPLDEAALAFLAECLGPSLSHLNLDVLPPCTAAHLALAAHLPHLRELRLGILVTAAQLSAPQLAALGASPGCPLELVCEQPLSAEHLAQLRAVDRGRVVLRARPA